MNAAVSLRAFDSPATYQILVLGDLPPSWYNRLDGMLISSITTSDRTEVTALVGELADQNALTGVLMTLVELHLSLISVQRVGGVRAGTGIVAQAER
jgi:hypothetical protein